MARRTREELLAEAQRVGAMWDVWRDFEMTHGDPTQRDQVAKYTHSSADWLSGVGRGGPRLSDIIAGFKQAVNDTSEMVMHGLQDHRPEAQAFLAFYRERTGRDWWADAGDIVRKVKAILERGRIRNETEWYLVESIVSHVDQPEFSAAEVTALETMRQTFEGRAKK